MIPTRIQSASNTSLLATVTATFSQTPAQGNLLIAAVTANVAAGSIAISGWSSVGSVSVGLTGALVLFYKIAGSSESTTVTSTATLAAFMDLHIFEYNNIDTTNPLNNYATFADSGSGVTSCSSGTTAQSPNGSTLTFVAIAQVLTNGGGASWTGSMLAEITTTHLISADAIVFANDPQTTTASWTTSQRAAGMIATFLQSQGNTYWKGGR